MFKRIVKLFSIILFVCIFLGLLILIIPRFVTAAYARGKVFTVSDVPVRRVAIVFGAGLYRNGSATRFWPTVLRPPPTCSLPAKSKSCS